VIKKLPKFEVNFAVEIISSHGQPQEKAYQNDNLIRSGFQIFKIPNFAVMV
jgi:hypothetical protein